MWHQSRYFEAKGHGAEGQSRTDTESPLLLGNHVVSEGSDVTDFHLDGVAREHVAVGSFGAHPQHVAGVQGGVLAKFVDPGSGVPNLVGRREVLPDRAIVPHDDKEPCGAQISDDPRPRGFQVSQFFPRNMVRSACCQGRSLMSLPML